MSIAMILQDYQTLESNFRELEDERDRLKGELEYQKTIEEQMDVINEGLRSRHAALVKLVTKIAQPISCGCNPCTGDCVSQNALQIYLDEIKAECKAALAKEVK